MASPTSLRGPNPLSGFRRLRAARPSGKLLAVALVVTGALALGVSRHFVATTAADPGVPGDPVNASPGPGPGDPGQPAVLQVLSLPTGKLRVKNRSHQLVKITSRSWTDGAGETVTRRVTWAIEPDETLTLQVDGKDLLARSFAYTCTTTHGSRDLSASYGGGGDFTVEITNGQVAQAPAPPAPPTVSLTSRPAPPAPLPPPPAAPPSRPEPPEDDGLTRFVKAVGEVADTVDKINKARESVSPATPRHGADVIVKSVTVAETDASGSVWDDSGPPDLKVYVEQTGFFGNSATTGTKRDCTFATFEEKTIRVSEGDTIRVIVYDADVFADDEIGRYEKLITADTLAQRTVDWTFGRVLSLRLEFQP